MNLGWDSFESQRPAALREPDPERSGAVLCTLLDGPPVQTVGHDPSFPQTSDALLVQKSEALFKREAEVFMPVPRKRLL